jgi:hypothetical protein
LLNDYGHWDISIVGEFDCLDFFGFIYEIEEIDTGRIYIGRKQFRTKTRADWRIYTSSSEDVKALIKERGKECFMFRILILCAGKSQLTYEEERLQYCSDVLRTRLPNGERKYLNKSIGYKHFAGVEKQTEQAKEKIRQSLSGRKRPDISEMKIGKKRLPHSVKGREKIRTSVEKFWSVQWLVINSSGDEFIVDNLQKFCSEHGLNRSHLSETSSGKRKKHKGWRCEKIEVPNPL